MTPFLQKIIAEKTPCFFISPHLDDAALSCGGLIGELEGKTNITVITVFTDTSTGAQTLSAKKSLKNSGFREAKSYYAARIKEDKQAFGKIHARVIHLGETEALWRKKPHPSKLQVLLGHFLPEVLHTYPIYGLHIARGRLAESDREVIFSIRKKLASLIPEKSLVFAPLGVGNHVDHVLVNRAVSDNYAPIYWVDQPYFLRNEASSSPGKLPKNMEEVTFQAEKKQNLLKSYASQIPLLFSGTTIPNLREYYIIPQA
jgi:LmbE family N-acetylglucosaminyl deacetylase